MRQVHKCECASIEIDKRVFEPMTGSNPTGRYSAQVRVNGWAWNEAFFDTKEEAQIWLDNYKYDGKIGESVLHLYREFFEKRERKTRGE
jgi:hypothetical protein